MKKTLILIVAALTTVSCGDYLITDSGDLLIPRSISQFAPLLYGEGYPSTFDADADWIRLMTDDVEIGPLEWDPESPHTRTPAVGFDETYGAGGYHAYLWKRDIEEYVTDRFWPRRYANILGCNTVIEALPTMEYDPATQSGKYNMLAAQAHTLRAYHYLCLVNTYALPWSEQNLGQPGVVIRLTPEVSSGGIGRATIGEVYELINDDLETALEYSALAEPVVNLNLITPLAIKFLAVRAALYQRDWDAVIEKGQAAIAENGYIFDLNSQKEEELGLDDNTSFYIRNLNINKEIIFTFGTYTSIDVGYFSKTNSLWETGLRTSHTDIYDSDDEAAPGRTLLQRSLISCYGEGDLRERAYFVRDIFTTSWLGEYWTYGYHRPKKHRPVSKLTGNDGCCECWRTVELYLNVAEAYAERDGGISKEAIELLNLLRVKRIKPDNYAPKSVSDFATRGELIEFIRDERRRELCFDELIRWWDLRRWGMPRVIHRDYTRPNSYQTYILDIGGNNYTLSIPRSETGKNDDITSNPRDNILPQ